MTPEHEAIWKHHLQYWSKTPASECGLRVAVLLDEWAGLHHFESSLMKKVEWSNTHWIEMKVNHASTTGQLATFDFSNLTNLVFLAHDHCIRIDVLPCNGSYLKLMFHPRKGREGGMGERHPTVEEALSKFRHKYPDRGRYPTPNSAFA